MEASKMILKVLGATFTKLYLACHLSFYETFFSPH